VYTIHAFIVIIHSPAGHRLYTGEQQTGLPLTM